MPGKKSGKMDESAIEKLPKDRPVVYKIENSKKENIYTGVAKSKANKRSTIYFDPDIQRALRLKAASTHCSVSELVNNAVRQSLKEDQDDLAAFEERAAEPTMSYESLLNVLESDGKL